MPSDDVERVRETLGERAARRYCALTDLQQTHLSDFARRRYRDVADS